MSAETDGPIGQLTAHVAGDDDVLAVQKLMRLAGRGLREVRRAGQIIGWSFNVGDGRIVYAGEISNRAFAELDEEERDAYGGKPCGWFLMCFWPDRCEVWAKCAGDDGARRLVTLIGSMLYAGALWRQDDTAAVRAAVDAADPSHATS